MTPPHLCSTLDEVTQGLEIRTATTELEISQLREALKKNQKNLHLFAGTLLDTLPLDLAGQLECGHGRIEQCNLRVAPLDSDISSFPHARQVLSCTRIYSSKNSGEDKAETRYFITG
ncbi:MAG: hypothetical protein DVB26_06315 [Verrucomicrobia bacterium]|nr:MAG: hypothetical protein DVB26_06315 [Verrucomicrobiota bacterium]